MGNNVYLDTQISLEFALFLKTNLSKYLEFLHYIDCSLEVVLLKKKK